MKTMKDNTGHDVPVKYVSRYDRVLDERAKRVLARFRRARADIAAFGAAFGLPAPSGDILDLLRTLRANRLVKTLQLADNLARRKGQALTWDVFAAAHNTVNN